MENASKALIMAGSILIAIMVISLLVYGYNQISNLEQTKANVERDTKTVEYMRKFEQYNRTLYGSELLSLANLQEDYNASEDVKSEGYTPTTIRVEITREIVGSKYFTAGTHLLSDIADDRKDVEEKISKYEKANSRYNNKSVKYYSQKTNREIAIDFGFDPPSTMLDYDIIPNFLEKDATTRRLLEDIEQYNSLTDIYNEFRIGKQFECKEVNYSRNNGRITEMFFREK